MVALVAIAGLLGLLYRDGMLNRFLPQTNRIADQSGQRLLVPRKPGRDPGLRLAARSKAGIRPAADWLKFIGPEVAAA